MTTRTSRWTPVRSALFGAFALALLVQACSVDSPVLSEAPEASIQATESDADVAARAERLVRARSELDRLREEPQATPFTVAPSILNRQAVVDAMEREYPPLLRDAGIGGQVIVSLLINESGEVEETRIAESSGHAALDDGAIAVSRVFRFTPAQGENGPTPVWVKFPITFRVN